MNSRWIWPAFLLALIALVASTAWSTQRALRLQREHTATLATASRENQIRLALFKMDSIIAPLLQQESNRPVADYHGDEPSPSPLQQRTPRYINVHFTCSSFSIDDITSPQVPDSNWITTATPDGSRLRLQVMSDNCACDTLSDSIFGPDHSAWPEDQMRPMWINDLLVLARRVRVQGVAEIQGFWLDWPALEGRLLAEISPLLPEAKLLPLSKTEPTDAAEVSERTANRTLASLPVGIDPGRVTGTPPPAPFSLRGPLAASWAGLLLASLATACLLFGILRLSRRRGDFVSAVTHELRTPLTGLQMNADLLADDLIDDPEQRAQISRRIQGESRRLGHLVENVLAYAGLEHGPGARRMKATSLHAVLERAAPRLKERAALAGLELELHLDDDRELETDPMAIEQILFNLVDNACKYAIDATQPRLELRQSDRTLTLRDFGPGIPPAERRKLFQPFHKSAAAAAGSAPGVGLGLALSRRLAAQLGAELKLAETEGQGATFSLRFKS